MKNFIYLLLIIVLTNYVSCDNYAVLVAGSNTWDNYRHQADICHAYQVLISKGFQKANIITMMADDIANNKQNPFKGQLFNRPSGSKPGQDVYNGCVIDYRDKDVTPQVFMAVLTGNSQKVTNRGNGRVLKSGKDDKVFINFVDHGAKGLVAFPFGDQDSNGLVSNYLYADDLIATLNQMHQQSMYNQLVFYMEACESGSMFANLPNNIGIYATTAANANESSWGTYCDEKQDLVQGHYLGCLGDLYSVNWMEDCDAEDTTQESLGAQYQLVKTKTNKSHVLEFGEKDFKQEPVSNFVGEQQTKSIQRIQYKILNMSQNKKSVDSRLIRLINLQNRAYNDQSVQSLLELQEHLNHIQFVDNQFNQLTQKYKLNQSDVSVNDYACLKQSVSMYEQVCGKFSTYSLKYVEKLVQICEKKIEFSEITNYFQKSCQITQ